MSLRVCPSCSTEYDEDVEQCPHDGTATVALEPTMVRSSADILAPAKAFVSSRQVPLVTDVAPATPWDDTGFERTAQSSGATAVIDPLVGTQVGEYVIQGALGEGGMGVVYEAHHPLIGKRVAIKCLKREIAANPEEAARLLAEARAANSIGHRGIIDIFGFGTLPDGRQYFAMELLQGQSLADRMARGPLSLGEALALLEEILGPLAAAHAAGVIHRDLKPSNIFLVAQRDGALFVKLLDFGLAKQAAVARGATPQTNVARILGTPEFMAPEQARGEPVSPRTDLYAFGIIAYELLVGRAPFEAATMWEVVGMHLNQPAPRVSDGNPEVPAALDALVGRLLAKAPSDRPSDAETVLAEVRRLRRELQVERTAAVLPAVSTRLDTPAVSQPPGPRAAQPAVARNSRGALPATRRPATPHAGAPRTSTAIDARPASTSTHDAFVPPARSRTGLVVAGLVALGVLGTVGLLALKTDTAATSDPVDPTPIAPVPVASPLQVVPLLAPGQGDAGAPAPIAADPPTATPVQQAPGDKPVTAPGPRPAAKPVAGDQLARLARVKAAWKAARAGRPAEDRDILDKSLGQLAGDVARNKVDRAKLKRSLDDFVEGALQGREP